MARLTPKWLLASALLIAGPAAANDANPPSVPPPAATAEPGPMPRFTPAATTSDSRPMPRFTPGTGGPTFGVPSVQNPRFGVNFKAAWGGFNFYLPQLTSKLRARWKQMIVPRRLNDARGRSIAITFTLTSDGVVDGTTARVAGEGTQEEKEMCQHVLLACSPYQPWTAAMIQKLGKSQELTVIFTF